MKLSLIRGDNKPLRIPTTLDGFVYDATGAETLIFTLKRRLSDPDSAAVAQKMSGGYGVTAGPDSVTLTLLFADTADLDPDYAYHWDVQAQDAQGVHTVALGTASVTGDVTRGLQPAIPIHTSNPPSGANVFSAVAAVDLGGGRFANVAPDGTLRYADAGLSLPTVGFVREAYTAGRTCVVEKAGQLTGLSGLSTGSTYYLTGTGLFSTVAPTAGIRQSVGTASSATTLEVVISEPVTLT